MTVTRPMPRHAARYFERQLVEVDRTDRTDRILRRFERGMDYTARVCFYAAMTLAAMGLLLCAAVYL